MIELQEFNELVGLPEVRESEQKYYAALKRVRKSCSFCNFDEFMPTDPPLL
jgi:hypothetical protein